jgi:hypothetical protein
MWWRSGVSSFHGGWGHRAALIAWWGGQVVCGFCCLAALWVLVQSGYDLPGQICAAALLLAGMAALLGGRALLMLAARGSRRHLLDY